MIDIIKNLFLLFIIYLPGKAGHKLRYFFYKNKFKNFGKNITIGKGVKFIGHELISIGDNVKIDDNCLIETGKNLIGNIKYKKIDNSTISIGELIIASNIHICRNVELIGYGGLLISNNSVISSSCKLYSHSSLSIDYNHKSKHVSLMPYENSFFINGPIIIKKNVWLGLEVIVNAGVIINEDAFVIMKSVVIHDIPENTVAKGFPAKGLKKRFLIE